MTANNEENRNSSPSGGRSALSVWAENNTLTGVIIELKARIDALLAEREAESGKVRRLKHKIAKLQAERGEPDFLITGDGYAWRRTGVDRYTWAAATGWTRERIENWSRNYGPVTEAWK